MRKFLVVLSSMIMTFALVACSSETDPVDNQEEVNYSGTYVGYSWKGEASGVKKEDASQYIETILTLDEEGIIIDASLNFFTLKNGFWTLRSSGNGFSSVDFSVDPSIAGPRVDGRSEGTSMFTTYVNDYMAFYTFAVDTDGTVAFGLVDPITRYLFEMKLDPTFDFSKSMSELTILSGDLVPTRLMSGASFLKPTDWSEVMDRHLFNMHPVYSHVINDVGVFAGVDEDSSVREFLEAAGIVFVDGVAQEHAVDYGYFGLGGWQGNLEAIAQSLIGRDAKTLNSIIDWETERYQLAVNSDNFFGVDVPAGATKTVQNSFDTIAGATVRVSREATSIQRALVQAGILKEEDVIVGRF